MNVMVTLRKCLVLGFALCVLSCSEKIIGSGPQIQLEGVTDTNATAIAIDADGDLVDFVHIKPGSEIEWIEFKAPENGEEIQVIVVGPNVHDQLPKGMLVASKVAEGYAGAVTVNVNDGVIEGVNGNSMRSRRILMLKHLEEVKSKLKGPKRKHPDSTVIVHRNKYVKGLVDDGHGNLIPEDITPDQKKFLSEVIANLKKADIAALKKYIHPKPKGARSYRDIEAYLKRVSKDKLLRYKFIRYDAEYHSALRMKNSWDSGSEMQSSLPVEWELDLYFSPKGAGVQHSANLKIGSDKGVLKFPTEYSK